MARMLRNRVGVLALFLLAACGGGGPVSVKSPPEPSEVSVKKAGGIDFAKINLLADVERRELPNGLSILVKEDHRLPTVAVMVAYRVGSVNESEPVTGVSHFLEHMMFKGTDRYKRGEIDLVTLKAGGANNAFTTHDMTGYWFKVSRDNVDEILQIEANRMVRCSFDPKEFEMERKVVIEELNRALDDPWGQLNQEMEKSMFIQHPYRHPVLGWRKDLETMTRDQMVGYYRMYYRPNNAVIVVVGDVDRVSIFKKMEELFGPIERGEDASTSIPVEPPQEGERRVDLKTERETPGIQLAYRTDRVGSPTDATLDLISEILAGAKTSRLNRRLVEKEKLAQEEGVEATNDSRRYGGLFFIQAELNEGVDPERVERCIEEEIEKLKLEAVGSAELEKTKNRVAAQFVFDRESQHQVAEGIGTFEALGASDYLRDYLVRVNAVTSTEILETVKRFFRAENQTVGFANQKPGRSFREGGTRPQRQGWECALRMPGVGGSSDLGEVWDVRLPNGLTVLVKRRPELPIVTLKAFVNAGPLYDPAEKAGLATAVGELLDEGIRRDIPPVRALTHEGIAEQIEFIGGRMTASPNGVSIKVLAQPDHLAVAYDLLADTMMYPSFPKERFEFVKDNLINMIKSRRNHPRNLARDLFCETVFKGHPLEHSPLGWENTVQAISLEDVKDYYRRFFRPDNATIVVVGDIRPGQAVGEVRKRFGEWTAEGDFALPVVSRLSRQEKPCVATEFRETNQVIVYFGHVGVDRHDPDFLALKVLEYCFCKGYGFTDRLSKRIREEEGLAYSVGGDITESASEAQGAFIVYVGTKADQKERALQAALAELKGIVEQGPTAEEVEAAKAFLLRNMVFEWETSDGVADFLIEMKRFRLGLDYPKRLAREIQTITRDRVHDVAKKLLDPNALTIVIVGPVDKDGKVTPTPEEK